MYYQCSYVLSMQLSIYNTVMFYQCSYVLSIHLCIIDIEPTVTNCDISDNNSQLKCVIADVTGKRCNVAFMLERHYNYM